MNCVKFLLVGGVVFLLDWFIFRGLLNMGCSAYSARLIAICVAVQCTFVGQRLIIEFDSKRNWQHAWWRHQLSNCMSTVCNIGCFSLFYLVTEAQFIAFLFAVVISTGINYLSALYWVHKV